MVRELSGNKSGKSLRDRFKAACASNATSMNEAIVELVQRYVEENETLQNRPDSNSAYKA
jgi:hypothetical protein